MINNFLLNATSSLSVAFKIGTLEVKWYGILITIGFICAIALAATKLRFWYKVPVDPFIYFCFIGIPVSILGGRLWSFIIGDAGKNGGNFFVDFWDFRTGGLAIQGAILFTVLAACIWFPLILKSPKYQVKTHDEKGESYVRQVSMWVYADAIIPCILVGQIIGRWGNYFNQELYGAAISEQQLMWLKNVMPKVFENMLINGSYRQPLFLYESFANFWVFLIIYVGFEFIPFRKAGDIGISYFFFYGVVRLSMEPFRDSQFQFITSIVTSILFIVFSIALIVINHLVLCKYRDKKILYAVCIKLRYYLFLQMVPRIKEIHNRYDNYGCTIKPKFVREPQEMLYYNGY